MTEPHQFSMEALVAEGGTCVTAGLPEGVRRELDRRKAAQLAATLPPDKHEHLAQLLAGIAELQCKLTQLHDELRETIREYATTTTPAA
jgi:hypothetical protein